MRCPFSAFALLAILLLAALPARSAEWPQNPLGVPDTSYIRLKVGVFYYGAVLQDLPDEKGVKPLPEGTDWLAQMAALPELTPEAMQAEQARVQAELNEGARFYWRNSRFNCAIDYTWFSDFTPRLRSTISAADAPYYGPQGPPEYEQAMRDFDGLIQIAVLYVYDKDTGQLKRVKGGGGFTNGCDPAKHTSGWSWFAACSADNVCGSDWLMVHEFGHQLDSLMDASGHPEFWFNHLALSEGNVARFGEHFDANAFILRRVPEKDWLDLKWGTVRHFMDSDSDGVPGACEWLSQRGFVTDPGDNSSDSDGDGLGDYAEYMVSSGNRFGHGDRLYPSLKPCDPADPDSDRDGVPDGVDPMPGFPGKEFIPRQVEGSSTCTNCVGFTDAPDGLDFGVELSYVPDRWDDAAGKDIPGALYVTFYWGRPGAAIEQREAKLMLDLENNGWFAGDDNYRITVDADKITSIRQNFATSATEWPHDDDKSVDVTKVPLEAVAPREGFATGVRLALTKEVFKELAVKPGAMIALNTGLRKAGQPWFYMLFDPNSLMALELR
jgi:hypothetical protein